MSAAHPNLRFGAVLVFVATLIVYLVTMPHTVTFEDAGLFSLSCHQGSPAHPPGYPLYSLLCHPFAHLPWLSTPHGLNILSALLGAASCAVLYLAVSRLFCHPAYGAMAALAYGFSRLFWSQAIIPEVYTLHALLFFTLFALMLAWLRTRDRRLLLWMAFVFGLSLSNHWPLMLLSVPVFLILLWPGRHQLSAQLQNPRRFLACAALFILGLTPYLFVAVRADMPLVNIFSRITDFASLIDYIDRSAYAHIDQQQDVIWADKLAYMKFLLRDFLDQYGVATVAIAAGFIYQWRLWHPAFATALTVNYLMSSWLLVFLLDFEATALWQVVFRVYPSVAYVSLALWLVIGIYWGIEALPASVGRVKKAAPAMLAVVAALTVAASNHAFNDRRNDTLAHSYAETVLHSLPQNSILLTLVGNYYLPLLERRVVGGVRPDVRFYTKLGNPMEPGLARQDVARLVGQTGKPVYYFVDMEHDYGIEDFGIYKKVRKDLPKGKTVYTVAPAAVAVLDQINGRTSSHPWNIYFARSIQSGLINVAQKLGLRSEQARPVLERILSKRDLERLKTPPSK